MEIILFTTVFFRFGWNAFKINKYLRDKKNLTTFAVNIFDHYEKDNFYFIRPSIHRGRL